MRVGNTLEYPFRAVDLKPAEKGLRFGVVLLFLTDLVPTDDTAALSFYSSQRDARWKASEVVGGTPGFALFDALSSTFCSLVGLRQGLLRAGTRYTVTLDGEPMGNGTLPIKSNHAAALPAATTLSGGNGTAWAFGRQRAVTPCVRSHAALPASTVPLPAPGMVVLHGTLTVSAPPEFSLVVTLNGEQIATFDAAPPPPPPEMSTTLPPPLPPPLVRTPCSSCLTDGEASCLQRCTASGTQQRRLLCPR